MNKGGRKRKPNYKCGKTKKDGGKRNHFLKILARAEQDENQLLN
jgi:hypothetical protein